MKPDLFKELLESVREGGAILRGQRKPSREIQSEREFERAFARSQDLLARLAKAALAEHRRGQTDELDPDKL